MPFDASTYPGDAAQRSARRSFSTGSTRFEFDNSKALSPRGNWQKVSTGSNFKPLSLLIAHYRAIDTAADNSAALVGDIPSHVLCVERQVVDLMHNAELGILKTPWCQVVELSMLNNLPGVAGSSLGSMAIERPAPD
jgi:hypothetical protein